MKNCDQQNIPLWTALFAKYFRKFSIARFKEKVGISPFVMNEIWCRSEMKKSMFIPRDLMIFFHFCKNYTVGSHQDFGLCYDTYNNVVHSVAAYLFDNLNEIAKTNVDLIMPSGIFDKCIGIVDSKEFRVRRPSLNSQQHAIYSGKKKCHTLKYQIVVLVKNGYLIHFYGPSRGSCADITVLKNSKFSLPNGYFLFADKGYQGHSLCVVPYKGRSLSYYQERFNAILSKIRVRVEHIFSYFHKYTCFETIWRHSFILHHRVTKIITETIQVEMEYGIQRNLSFFME